MLFFFFFFQVLIHRDGTSAPQNLHEETRTVPEPTSSSEPEIRPAPIAERRDGVHVDHELPEEDDDAVLHGNDEKDEYDNSPKSEGSSAVPTGQRTVLLRSLPDRVTHYDITEAVRGGALLDIFLRAREHMASVSFIEESAAQEFLNHVRQHGFFVGGKRVSLFFSFMLVLSTR